MCMLTETNSNQENSNQERVTNSNQEIRTVDTSSKQRDGTMDWPRVGLRCTGPAVPKIELWFEPADPNKWGCGMNQG